MSAINDKETVQKQYKNTTNLNTRISIHDKYSVNKQGFGNWILSNYKIRQGMKILELGCGTGYIWKDQAALIGKCSQLVLTDFSEAMLETAKETVGHYKNLSFQTVDIQDIPFETNSFDAVIANMMLHHVPDLRRGLSEVKRVLKEDGKFYCAAYGRHGIVAYIADLLKSYGVEDQVNKSFTLQNGKEKLAEYFNSVELLEYADSLEVTNMEDILDYMYSLSDMTEINRVERSTVKKVLEQHMVNGILKVPKEYGMFICRTTPAGLKSRQEL